MTDTFCILPWIHLILLPDGLLRICCLASQHIKKNGVPMSVYDYSLEEIWNSDHLRSVRRNMVEGKPVGDCSVCYHLEKTSDASYRTLSNARWSEELGSSFQDVVDESRSRDFAAPQLPIYFQLIPGNLCNLKCRMCSPLFSSQIEKDDVHIRWSPKLTGAMAQLVDWTEDQVTIGPQLRQGVEITGMHSLEIQDNRPLRWTNGDATFRLSVPSRLQVKSLLLRIGGYHPDNHHLRVEVNEHRLYDGMLSSNPFQQEFDIPEMRDGDQFTVRLLSDTFRNDNDPRDVGVAVETLKLSVKKKRLQEKSFLPAVPAKPWITDRSWVFTELLRSPERLRSLYFTGGEPMIQREVEKIIDHLIDRQVTNNITLEFNINCTVLRDSLLRKLSSFRTLYFGLSIDAYGAYNEYMRYPGRWDVISKNVSKLLQLSGEKFAVHAVPVLQVYNALNIVDLLKFFDRTGLAYKISIISEPWFLGLGVLPARARQIAADRLRAYSKTELCAANREHVLTVADQIESVPDNCNAESLRTFMLFTNDLDATRGQDFRKLHHELLDIIQETGFQWTDERRFRELGDDRVAWSNYAEALSHELRRSEAERIALSEQLKALEEQLKASEADRAARLKVIKDQDEQLQVSEEDRAARLKVIKDQDEIITGSLIGLHYHRKKRKKALARENES